MRGTTRVRAVVKRGKPTVYRAVRQCTGAVLRFTTLSLSGEASAPSCHANPSARRASPLVPRQPPASATPLAATSTASWGPSLAGPAGPPTWWKGCWAPGSPRWAVGTPSPWRWEQVSCRVGDSEPPPPASGQRWGSVGSACRLCLPRRRGLHLGQERPGPPGQKGGGDEDPPAGAAGGGPPQPGRLGLLLPWHHPAHPQA